MVSLFGTLRTLPRLLWWLALVTLVNRMGAMALPFLLLFLTKDRGLDESVAANVLALFGVGSLVAAPLGGYLSDRIGAGATLLVALVGGGAALVLLPLGQGAVPLAAVIFAWAVLSEMGRPASMTMATHLTAPEQRKSGVSLVRMAINAGMSIGPVVGGWLAAVSYALLFWVDAATSMLAALVLVATLPLGRTSAAPRVSRTAALGDRRLAVFLVGFALAWVPFTLDFGPLSLIVVDELGRTTRFFGLLMAINTVGCVLFEVPVSAATTHWSARRAVVLGGGLIALGAVAMLPAAPRVAAMLGLDPHAVGWAFAVASMVLFTAGEIVLLPSVYAFVTHLAPEGQEGAYMGAYSLAAGLGLLVGPWLGTQVLAHLGSAWMWAFGAAMGIVGTALMGRVAKA